jgi:MHS family shikimate/dehydroshikimate transporter-like MFS transporter
MAFSYAAYAAGYPAPTRAFLFGHFGDRTGRKAAFLSNLLIVGGATCLTGLLPGYATLGIAAPVLLVTLRLVQGIGVGWRDWRYHLVARRVRRSAAISSLLDVAGQLGISFGVIIAGGVLLALSATFTTTGWRIAMLLSAVIVIPAVIARYKLTDSPLFV